MFGFWRVVFWGLCLGVCLGGGGQVGPAWAADPLAEYTEGPYKAFNRDRPDFSSCQCPRVEVICSDSAKAQVCTAAFEACAKPSECKLYVSSAVCEQFNLSPQSYRSSELAERIRCKRPDFEQMVRNNEGIGDGPPEKRAGRKLATEISNCAVLSHELTHNCAGRDVERQFGKLSYPCNEFMANMAERLIHQSAIRYYCDSAAERAKPVRFSACRFLCFVAYSSAIVGSWTECTCRTTDKPAGIFGEWMTNDSCCNCYNQCDTGNTTHGKNWIPPYCWDTILDTAELKEKLLPLQKQQCEDFAYGQAGYSCANFAKEKRRFARCR